MAYPPDPGGIFTSDAHRRVMAHLPNPNDDALDIEALILERINHDPHTLLLFTDASEVVDVLEDLKADGYAKELKSGWKNTPDGFDALTAPPNETGTDTAQAPAAIGLDPATLNGGTG